MVGEVFPSSPFAGRIALLFFCALEQDAEKKHRTQRVTARQRPWAGNDTKPLQNGLPRGLGHASTVAVDATRVGAAAPSGHTYSKSGECDLCGSCDGPYQHADFECSAYQGRTFGSGFVDGQPYNHLRPKLWCQPFSSHYQYWQYADRISNKFCQPIRRQL